MDEAHPRIMTRMSTSATVVSDASYIGGAAGTGFVARVGDRLVLSSRNVDDEGRNSISSEAIGIRNAIARCVEVNPRLREMLVYCDCESVVGAVNGTSSSKSIRGEMAHIQDLVEFFGIALTMRWVKGHSSGTPLRTFNGISHNLAYLGRLGIDVDYDIPLRRSWRLDVTMLDQRLIKDDLPFWMPITVAAKSLCLPAKTVYQLAAAGHLEGRGYEVTRTSVEKMRRVVIDMRKRANAEAEASEAEPAPAPAM